jgi:DNA-binding NtrC family response regulator
MTAIRYHLFIVDDEPTIREGIALALEDDYRITAFANAEDALADLDKAAPDLVLLDIGLPGMNGIEALAHIKRHDPHILVIMITAFEDIDGVIRSMKLGALYRGEQRHPGGHGSHPTRFPQCRHTHSDRR